MDIRKISLTCACALLLIQGAANGDDDKQPGRCFKKSIDYKLYYMYGEKPQYAAPEDFPADELQEFIDSGGKLRRNDVVINYTYHIENGILTFDASSSKTPSGEIMYAWENSPYTFSKTDSKASTQVGSPGHVSIEVNVWDPVCKVKGTKRLVAEVK
ncbi:MAG: hypothetical protein LBJ37_13725 [Paucimonas sp.]|nr:hypothetical protein [Paucimonas sp.]